MLESDTVFDQSALFCDASGKLRRLLDEGMRPLRLASGEALFDQGDEDDRLFVLDEGLLEVSVLSASGRKLSLNQLRPTSVFGEIAIFDPGPRTARIEALKPSRLRAIGHGTLMAALRAEPDLAEELLRLAGRRMRWMSQQMEDQVFLPQPSRLAAKILYLMGNGTEVNMSQAQLADHVGATREAVSKTLAEWRREGIVEVGRGRIVVLDAEALHDIKAVDFV